MATQQTELFSLARLVMLLLLIQVSPARSGSYHITVSADGNDTEHCMFQAKACKTLQHVLLSLSHLSSASTCYINVTYDQNMHIKNFPQFSINIAIFSERNFLINFIESFEFTGNKQNSLKWAGVCFIGMEPYHQHFAKLEIQACIIQSRFIGIKDSSIVIIQDSIVGNKSLSTEPCPVLTFQMATVASSINISNCTFSHCMVVPTYGLITLIDHIESLQFEKNSILFITIRKTKYNILFLYKFITITNKDVNFSIKIVFQQNRFIQNTYKGDIIAFYTGSLIELTTYKGLVIFNGNRFIGNTNIPLLTFIAQHNLEVTMKDTVIKSNVMSGDREFMLFKKPSLTDTFNVKMESVVAKGNIIKIVSEQFFISSQPVILSFKNLNSLVISNSTFIENIGTSIMVSAVSKDRQTKLTFKGDSFFINNTALKGGACEYNNVKFTNYEYSYMLFKNNSAIYGGAVYLAAYSFDECTHCNMRLVFINNNAVTAGNSIYLSDAGNTHELLKYLLCNATFNMNDLASVAVHMDYVPIGNNTSHMMFPGQALIINITIIDMFNAPSSCPANVYLRCNIQFFSCGNIEMQGIEPVVISQKANTTMTTLHTGLVLSAFENNTDQNINVLFICRESNIRMKVPLSIVKCPFGFVYNQSKSACECAKVVNKNFYSCSVMLGKACVAYGYWYGSVIINSNINIVANCRFPECDQSYTPCPAVLQPSGTSATYILLSHDQDNQCSQGRGGVLCASCKKNHTFTFTSVRCVPTENCTWWQPFVVLVLSLSFQILLALILVVVVRFKLAVGSGFLYGPMLFLAVVGDLSLEHMPAYTILTTIVKVMSSILHLNLEVFGFIPWCFTSSLGKLYNYSLRYLGPATVLLVIILLSVVANTCPKTLRRWQSSPLRVFCLLLVLSFWSLTNTSINIITPTPIQYTNYSVQYRVSIQPDLLYFSTDHIPVAIPALLIVSLVLAPLLVLLLVSPLMIKVEALNSCKYYLVPFLDEFQSCYKDRYCWYSAFYFVLWFILVITKGLVTPRAITQTIFTIVLATHVFLQPYRSRVLNITDTILLIDLNLIVALTESQQLQDTIDNTTFILLHILIIVPLFGLLVWFSLVLVFVKFRLYRYIKNWWNARRKSSSPDSAEEEAARVGNEAARIERVNLFDVSADEREPMIGIVNYLPRD